MNLRRALILAALVLAAALIRFWHIDAQSLWFDEGIAWHVATQPDLASAVVADPTNPPLYFLLLFANVRLTGDSEVALRWLSVMIGLLAVPLSYQLARKLFNPTAGVLAALLAACSPPLWWASQEIRMYGLMVVLALIAALAWHHLLERDSRRAWLALWAAELGLLYSHSTGPVFVLWLNVITLLAWLSRQNLRRPRWQTWLAGQVGVALLWSPWLVARFVLLPSANQTVISPPPLTPELLGQIWQWQWAGSWSLVSQVPALALAAAVAFVLWLVVLDWRKAATRWLVLHALLLITGVLAGLTLVGINLHGRYLVAAAPFTLVALAGGLSRLASASRRLTARLAASATVMIFVTLSAAGIVIAGINPAYQHDDVRGMVRYYAETLSAQDTVIARSYVDRYEFAYYWPRLGVQAQRLVLPETAGWDDLAQQVPHSGRVAENFWFAQRGDYRRMLSCMLGHGSANPPDWFQTFGLGNDLHAVAPAQLPHMQAFDSRFEPAQVTAIGIPPAFTAELAVCLPIQIVLMQPTSQPLKVALIARNSLGWEIARADAVFARVVETQDIASLQPASLQPASLQAYPLLRLPYGAPAGRYTLIARLYDESNLSGYDLLGENGTPAGKDLTIATWTVNPGADWSQVRPPANLHVETQDVASVATQATVETQDFASLLSHDAGAQSAAPVHNGDRIRLTLLWRTEDRLPVLTLADTNAGWRVDAPASVHATGITLDWREIIIPADAPDGVAELSLPDGRVLARFTVESLPAEFVEPAYTTPVSATLPGVGSLVGYSLAGDPQSIDRSVPLSITLVWRAEATPLTSYTVFVQLLNADGRLIAQSDALPAQGARPTTSWRSGEYILDTHAVTFKADATPGPARLIVGLYDANTGQRLPVSGGADAISLPTALQIR